jgi:hypothetical protein
MSGESGTEIRPAQPIEEEDDLYAVISVSMHQPGPERCPCYWQFDPAVITSTVRHRCRVAEFRAQVE